MLRAPGSRKRPRHCSGQIAHKAVRCSKTAKFVGRTSSSSSRSHLHDKYICNFSVFQSLPDHWALDQLFPVIPVHRLERGADPHGPRLVDITCDSDGEVDKFVDRAEIKDSLEVHELIEGEPYYLGFMLVGAYQDTMGDLHNAFGRVHEIEVVQEDGGYRIRRVLRGEPASAVLRWFGYDSEELIDGIAAALERRVEAAEIPAAEAEGLLDDYRRRLARYTYLD